MRLSNRVVFAVALPAALIACGGDKIVGPSNACAFVAVPVTGTTNAPTITHVGLEVQSDGIVAVATVTDPQGSANITGIQQTVGVHVDAQCSGAPIVLQDDIAASGVEETFGTAVLKSAKPALYNAIAAATNWPVTVDVVDANGNRTKGTVRAQLIR